MKSKTIDAATLNDYLPYLQQSDLGDSINDKLRFSLSVALFISRTISLERAASLAGKTASEFIEMMIDKNIAWFNYTHESYNLDSDAIKKYKSLRDD